MKKSIKNLLLGFILISVFLNQIESKDSDTISHQKEELELFKNYQLYEFKNLTNYLIEFNISNEIVPLTLELESKDEIIVLAEEEIPVII